MKIELKEITIKQLSKDYIDNNDGGVTGYGGSLDIRPIYQREFIYKDKQRDAVIDTIIKGFPLNVMYWAVRDNGNFEIIDGQQRTISICQYVAGDFSYNERYFGNLQDDERNNILDYELMIYQCTGMPSEKLGWFEIINIAGAELTPQELKNAVYSGTWITDAKRYFSKPGCPASSIGDDYMKGSSIRQEYLETAIRWISKNKIKDYMGIHLQDKDAEPLWDYFKNVIGWVETTFPNKRTSLMKKVDWGPLYDDYRNARLNPKKIEKEIIELLLNDEITKYDGVYTYVLTGDEKCLSIRTFSENVKRKVYEQQKGICKICKEHFELSDMDADHKKPWHKGGRTIESNCQMICRIDNLKKSGK